MGNAYIRFQDNIDEDILGDADDDASFLSKFIFYWVNPLIKKGIAGKLKEVDDLFDLPESLNIASLTETFHQSVDNKRTLFRALHKSFGREFYSIGLLRLMSDMSGFCGPILLGLLLRGTDSTENSYRPYLCALGLFGSTLLGTYITSMFSNTNDSEVNS